MSKASHLTGFCHRKPEHPGAFLERCYLKPLNINQTELAKMLGVSRRRLNEIINGQRAITADTAIRLARCLKATPMFWLEKQLLWELYEVSHEGSYESSHQVELNKINGK